METRAERERMAREAFRKAARVVARERRMRLGDVLEPRGRERQRARAIASYLAVIGFNACGKHVASAAGVPRHTVEKQVRRVEDRRDDPRFDGWLSKLEGQLHA